MSTPARPWYVWLISAPVALAFFAGGRRREPRG